MPPKKGATFAAMLNSDDSDVEDAGFQEESSQRNTSRTGATVKKSRKRKPMSKRLSGGLSKRSTKTATKPKEKIAPEDSAAEEPSYDDSTLEQAGADDAEINADEEGEVTEEEDEEEQEVSEAPKKKRGRPPKGAAPAKPAVSKKSSSVRSKEPAPKTRGRPKKAVVVEDFEAQEEEADPEELEKPLEESQVDEEEIEQDEEDEIPGEPVQPPSPPKQKGRSSKPSRKATVVATAATPAISSTAISSANAKRKRAEMADAQIEGGVDDDDHDENDGRATRRKLGNMTERYETLQQRYNKLQEIGIRQADANFDRLKEQNRAQERAAGELINSLKAELAAAHKGAADARTLAAELDAVEERAAGLREEFTAVQAENRALQAKLAATRQASTEPNHAAARMPGSAVKGKGAAAAAASSAAAAAQAAKAQLKEDLYSDLTGLIIRDVEQEEDTDIYDCLQTGINGTLHFQLEVHKSDPSASLDATVYTYTPKIDERRDGELFEILPEYMTGAEGIDFPGAKAATFYSRISDFLTRKIK